MRTTRRQATSSHLPILYRMPLGDGAKQQWHANPVARDQGAPTRRYSTAGLSVRLIILPPLLAVLAGAAWLLWVAMADAVGEDSVIFVLPVLAVIALIIAYHAAPSFAGSSALLGWCCFLAMVWGVVGMLVWAAIAG